jgi:hypothetical protein
MSWDIRNRSRAIEKINTFKTFGISKNADKGSSESLPSVSAASAICWTYAFGALHLRYEFNRYICLTDIL